MSISITNRRFTKLLGFGSLFAALTASAFAVTAVTSASYTEVTLGSPSKVTDYVAPGTDMNFANMSLNLTSVTTAAGLQTFNSSIQIQSVDFRVASGSTATASLALRTISSNSVQTGTFTSFTDVLGKGNNNNAISNALVNSTTTTGYERIDVSFTSGHVVAANDVIVLMGLGMLQETSSFLVAGLTSALSGDGTSAQYADAGHLVRSSDFGTGQGLKNYYNAVFNDGALAGSPNLLTTSKVAASGVVISLTDLGFNVGDSIFGFSIMGSDVKATTAAELADYNVGSVYLNNTGVAAGGLDFTSFNVGSLSPVPEPSTYGAILTAGSLGFFAWRRRRQSRAA